MGNNRIDLDIDSGKQAKYCGDPNFTFNQLVSAKQKSDSEIRIFTDGSRFRSEDHNPPEVYVGAAIWIPKMQHVGRFKLSPESSSFAAEAHAILKALDFIKQNNIPYSNICSDSELLAGRCIFGIWKIQVMSACKGY